MSRSGLGQDINFYRVPRQPLLDDLLELRVLLALTALLLLAVLLECLWSAQVLRASQRELAAATAARGSAQARLDTLQAERGRLQQQHGADTELQALQAVTAQLREARQLYRGFSARGNDLAGAHLSGIWLTRIHFENGREPLLLLEGRAREASLLPRYIAALSHSGHLHAAALYQLTLAHADADAVSFTLSNRPRAAAGARP
ncbi:MAG: hypothetical protein K0S46_646 [Moraxellaceae bacterium]|jgi:hypothetical protein|nr:hypothetical protein [Moraxellaceae bacterium]